MSDRVTAVVQTLGLRPGDRIVSDWPDGTEGVLVVQSEPELLEISKGSTWVAYDIWYAIEMAVEGQPALSAVYLARSNDRFCVAY